MLRISPIPDRLEACRDTVKGTHVDIVDLLDTPNTEKQVQVFNSVQQLSNYTKDTRKYFPKENAYAGGVLKFLLREIISPPTVVASNRSGRGRGLRNA